MHDDFILRAVVGESSGSWSVVQCSVALTGMLQPNFESTVALTSSSYIGMAMAMEA